MLQSSKISGTQYQNAGQLHIDIMAVLCNTKQNTVHGVLRAILCDSLYHAENTCLEQIEKFGSMQALREMTACYTSYADEKYEPYDLAAQILLTAFSAVGDETVLSGLEKYLSPEHQPACYAFIDEWNASAEQESCSKLQTILQSGCGLQSVWKKWIQQF